MQNNYEIKPNLIKDITIILNILTALLFGISAYPQDKYCDSLLNEIIKSKVDTIKIIDYNKLADHVKDFNPDDALKYYMKALEITKNSNSFRNIQLTAYTLNSIANTYAYNFSDFNQSKLYAEKAREIFQKYSEDIDTNVSKWAKDGIADMYNLDASVCYYQGNYSEAIILFKKSIDIYKQLKDANSEITGIGNLGITYQHIGDYVHSVEYIQIQLNYEEKRNNKKGIAKSYNNLATVYVRQQIFEKAKEYFEKAIEIAKELNYKDGLSKYYGNIGVVYYNLGLSSESAKDSLFDIGIKYFNDAITLYTELNFQEGISDCYNNMSLIYIEKHDYDKAISALQNSLEIKKKVEDKEGEAMSYNNLAMIFNNQGKFEKAKQYAEIAYNYAENLKMLATKASSCQRLADAYSGLGQHKKAVLFYKELVDIKDSLFSKDKTNAIANMEAKYETEKKQLQIDNLNTENALKKAELSQSEEKRNKQIIIIYSLIIVFIIIIVFSVIIFRLFIQKKKANIILAQQNVEISQQKEEISAQRDEIEAQRDLVTQQKDHIEEIHKEVTDSINYAERIQRSFMATKSVLNENLNDFFVLFHPKDVVSGDFYWAGKLKNNNFAIVTADSTGHGVPGAIMSILNISSIEKAVENGLYEPAEIFNHTRRNIIDRLKNDGSSEGGKDGMDASIIIFEKERDLFKYSAANNPVWVIRDNTLIELEPDKMPVGKHDKDQISFTQHEFQLQKNDIIYTLSDGFQDQFGGPKGKKFMTKNLKKLIIDNCKKPMSEQKAILEKTLIEWIGDSEQIDDITLLGIKI